MTDFPIKITPCPIKEVIFEIRFTSSIPEDAVFGIIFNQFKNDYNNTATPLPILEVPAVVRNQDPNLMFSPHYKMETDLYNMQIGPKVISLTNIKEYVGWELFQSKILELYEKLKEINIIDRFDQFSLRYINVFSNEDVFKKSSLEIKLGGELLDAPSINLSTQIKHNNGVSSSITAISGVQARIVDEIINGSVLDINSSIIDISNENFSSLLQKIHNKEKSLFYKIIGAEYLKSLNPTYTK